MNATGSRRPFSARWAPNSTKAGTKELTKRVNELLTALERLTLERDEIRADRDKLQRKLSEAEDDLAAARVAGKEMFKRINRA